MLDPSRFKWRHFEAEVIQFVSCGRDVHPDQQALLLSLTDG
jgi:hypothetical protein